MDIGAGRLSFAAMLLVAASTSHAETYLLVRIETAEGVPPPKWLYGYRVLPQPNRYGRGYVVPNSRRHWRLEGQLELLRIRPRRLRLRHLDFTDGWRALGFPDRILADDLELKIRPGAIHFIGDLVVGEDSVVNVWRPRTLLEACDRYPREMREHRFILARPYAETDLEFQNPCDTQRLEAREIQ